MNPMDQVIWFHAPSNAFLLIGSEKKCYQYLSLVLVVPRSGILRRMAHEIVPFQADENNFPGNV